MHVRGFSFVEMMIAVGVIGILAVVMMPLYTGYMTRSKVSEPLTLLAGLRQPMAEYHLTWGVWPAISSIGGKTSGRYTSIIEIGGPANFSYKNENKEGYYLQATMKADPNVGGKQIRMAYIVEYKDWICTLEGAPDPIPEKYLPSSCR